jgi:ADP-sugar diphosphatase
MQLDGSGQFKGVAAKELEEEVDLVVNSSHLFDMTEEIYGSEWPGMFPSIGGCDEFIRLFLHCRDVSEEELKIIESKTGGIEGEDIIHVKLARLEDAYKLSPDAKTLCSLFLYEKMKKNGILDRILKEKRFG